MEPEPPGAAFFTLEPEPTQVGRSRSRLQYLGHLEPETEQPKKVAAPQHCLYSIPLLDLIVQVWFVRLNLLLQFH